MNIGDLLEFTYTGNLLGEYATVLLLQVLLYLLATCLVAMFYKVFSLAGIGRKIELRPTYPNQIRNEIFGSLGTCGLIALYFYGAFAFVDNVYPDDWMSLLFEVLAFIIIYDFYMYITHRVLHTHWLRKFHSMHHKAISTTPWSGIHMHPIEALINYFPFLVFASLTPVSLAALVGVHAYLIFGIANGHSNYSLTTLSRTPFLLRELIIFHQKHHSDGRKNFGYLYTHWDWVFGTRHG
ncbi:MAG: sterol desaturase family protein [Gammaproteobacteria bacterium]|nr:sterol desaturase family protein [Gammaproteobacteria bacterium]